MQYIQTKTVYIDRDELIEIKAIEHDVKTRFIDFKFIAANKILDISNCIVRVYALNSKGNEIFNNLTIVDGLKGIARLELTDALLVPGTIEYMLKITTDNGGILSSNRFNLIVDKDLMTGNAIEGTNEYKALDEALKTVGELNSMKVNIEKNATNIDNTKKELNKNLETGLSELSSNTKKLIDDFRSLMEYIEINLNDYSNIAKSGTNEEDWSLAFNYVFQNVVKNRCATIKWNGQLKVKSTINVPYGVCLEGASLPYAGLVPTSDFVGEWIINDSNTKSHNSYRNIYLAFANNQEVKGLNILNPYDYCQVEKIVGDSPNNTFISIGGSAISQTFHMSDCICYGKTTCKGALYIIKNLQEGYIVNNKALFSGVGSTHPMYCDSVTNTTFLNNSFGFSTATGLKMVCIDYPKRLVGNLIEGNLFENCNGDYAIEIIGNSDTQYEGYNNTIRDNSYFSSAEKIYVDAISDIFIVDKAMLQRGSSARRVTFIQKYDSNSNDPYENLTIGFDGKKINITGDVYVNSLTGDIYIPNPSNKKLLSSIKRNVQGSTGADEGLEISVDGDVKMKLKNNHIYNWKSGGGIVLWSPDGTGYLTTVDNDGTLKTTKL